jgi:hypothetical protein
MSLKIGPISARKGARLTIELTPDDAELLDDYSAIHAEIFGAQTPQSELARAMMRQFLKSDAAFQRARKLRRQQPSAKE